MRVLFRLEARKEAVDAQRWYESRSVGLGLEFARALDAAVSVAVRHPNTHPTIEGECRRVLLRRFPFSMVYRVREDEFLVVAVFHHRREPEVLVRRTGA
jgi:toxin ParE1/3/4